jgi:hypothetical protein
MVSIRTIVESIHKSSKGDKGDKGDKKGDDLTECSVCQKQLSRSHTFKCAKGHRTCGGCCGNWIKAQVKEKRDATCPICSVPMHNAARKLGYDITTDEVEDRLDRMTLGPGSHCSRASSPTRSVSTRAPSVYSASDSVHSSSSKPSRSKSQAGSERSHASSSHSTSKHAPSKHAPSESGRSSSSKLSRSASDAGNKHSRAPSKYAPSEAGSSKTVKPSKSHGSKHSHAGSAHAPSESGSSHRSHSSRALVPYEPHHRGPSSEASSTTRSRCNTCGSSKSRALVNIKESDDDDFVDKYSPPLSPTNTTSSSIFPGTHLTTARSGHVKSFNSPRRAMTAVVQQPVVVVQPTEQHLHVHLHGARSWEMRNTSSRDLGPLGRPASPSESDLSDDPWFQYFGR